MQSQSLLPSFLDCNRRELPSLENTEEHILLIDTPSLTDEDVLGWNKGKFHSPTEQQNPETENTN